MKRKIFALFLALTLTFQLVTPVFADTEEAETTAATEAVLETEIPTEVSTEAPATEAPETAAPTETEPTETTDATAVPVTTEPTQAVETTAPTETAEVTEETTEPTVEITEPALDLFAEDDDAITSGICGAQGDNLTWTYQDGTLTISGEGDMADYSANCTAPWQGYTEIKKIVLEPGVTSIGDFAFYSCYANSVEIAESVNKIGEFAFALSGLNEVKIPDGVISIGDYAFGYCWQIAAVAMPDSVTTIGVGAFACSSLTSVAIPKNVTKIPALAFYECSSLISVRIPADVTSIGEDAFSGCEKLKEVSYGGSRADWGNIQIEMGNTGLLNAKLSCDTEGEPFTEIRPLDIRYLVSGGKVTLTAWAIPGEDQVSTRWSLAPEDGAYASITSAGVLTAKKVTTRKSVTITATPTNGAPVATRTIQILPKVKGIDLYLNASDEPVGKAVDLDIDDDVTFTFDVRPEGALYKVTWTSSNQEVATVDRDGDVTLLAPGTTIIKATAADGSKVSKQVTLNVTKQDHSPRLEASTLTLNTALDDGTTSTRLVECGDIIREVSVDDDRFEVKYLWDDQLILKAAKNSAAELNGTYKMTLTAKSLNENYTYPLTVKVIRTLPKLTVKQSEKFNLFYTDSEVALDISGAEVEEVELSDTEDFWLRTRSNDQWTICYDKPYDPPMQPDTKATLTIWLEGYSIPVIQEFTIATINAAPKLSLSSVASTVNSDTWYSLSTQVEILGLDDEIEDVWTDDKSVEIYCSDNELTLILEDGAESRTVNIYVKGEDWMEPVKLTHEITVTDELPTLKFTNGTLKLNSHFPKKTASTGMTLSQSNVDVLDVKLISTAKEDTPARAEADKLNVGYDALAEGIVVEIADTSIKKGTYTFSCIGTLVGLNKDNVEIPGGTLKVTVTDALPKAKLSASTVKLNKKLAGEECATVAVNLTGGDGCTLEGFENLPEGMDFKDGILTVMLPNENSVGGAYALYAVVSQNGENVTLPTPLTLKVQAYDKAPTVKFTAKGKLDVLNPASEIVYTPKLTNATGTITDVRLEGQDAKLFNAEVVDGLVHLKLAESGENYFTKKTYKVTPVVTLLGKDITGPTLSVKVTQSAMKLAKLPNRTVYQTQTAPLTVELAVTSPLTAEIGDVQLNAKTTAALWNTLKNAGGIDFEADTVTFPASAFAALKPGKYSVILDVFPSNAASDTKPIQAKFTLTVQK